MGLGILMYVNVQQVDSDDLEGVIVSDAVRDKFKSCYNNNVQKSTSSYS